MVPALRQSLLATAVLAFAGSAAVAQEVDGDAFVARLQSALSEGGATLTHGAVRVEGQDVIVEDVSFGTGEDARAIGETRFEGVSGSNAEGWRAERNVVDEVETVDGENRTTVSGLVFEGLTIAPEGAGTTTPQEGRNAAIHLPGGSVPLWIERGTLASMRVENGGVEVFSIQDVAVANEWDEAGAFAFDMNVGSFTADFSAQADEENEAEDVVRKLGYERVTGDIEANGLWNMETGELALSPLRLNVEDMANMVFAYRISGYTPAFIEQLSALQEQMAADPEGQNAGGMAMIGLLSQLSLHDAELRLEDASLTNRLLDYYAEQNGQSRDELIDQLLGMLPLALGYLNNPEFQQQVTEAVENFLRDPQSITASIAPNEPVPATQIIGAAMGAPQTLPAVLDLTVTSND